MNRIALCMLILIVGTAGCTTYHDLSNSPEVRQSGLIGKRFVLLQDTALLRRQVSKFDELVPDQRGISGAPKGTLPKDTILSIREVVEEGTIEITTRHPIAEVQTGAQAGRRVSMSRLLRARIMDDRFVAEVARSE